LKPGARWRAADWAMAEKNYNQRRACALAGIDPRVYRRGSTRPANAELRERLKELSSETAALRRSSAAPAARP